MLLIYLIPLMSAFIVAIANLALKRAFKDGFGVMQATFFIAWLLLIATSFTLLISHEVYDWSRLWVPILTGLLVLIGNILINASFSTGDVTVQTPLQGTKVIFVATISLFLIPGAIPLSWWIGTILTFISVMLIGSKDLFTKRHSLLAIIYSILSSVLFALTDVIVAKESTLFGKWPFFFIMALSFALFSLTLIPFFHGRLFSLPKLTMKWGLIGVVCVVLQHFALLFVLSTYRMPTVVNIVYSARSIFAIVLTWYAGHLFGNVEKDAGKSIFIRRFIGSVLLSIAIIVVLVE